MHRSTRKKYSPVDTKAACLYAKRGGRVLESISSKQVRWSGGKDASEFRVWSRRNVTWVTWQGHQLKFEPSTTLILEAIYPLARKMPIFDSQSKYVFGEGKPLKFCHWPHCPLGQSKAAFAHRKMRVCGKCTVVRYCVSIAWILGCQYFDVVN